MQHPLSTKALLSWLMKHSPSKSYSYIGTKQDHCDCLIGQYLTSLGFKVIGVYYDSYKVEGRYCYMPKYWDHIAGGDVKMDKHEQTFGQAIKRAKKCIENEVV
jgi:hypothetical protein